MIATGECIRASGRSDKAEVGSSGPAEARLNCPLGLLRDSPDSLPPLMLMGTVDNLVSREMEAKIIYKRAGLEILSIVD
jgi:hypothetical protein